MKRQFFVFWIDNRTPPGKSSLRWSLPFGSPRDAGDHAKDKVAKGYATLACVFAYGGDEDADLMHTFTYPKNARIVINHYLDMQALADEGPPPHEKGI